MSKLEAGLRLFELLHAVSYVHPTVYHEDWVEAEIRVRDMETAFKRAKEHFKNLEKLEDSISECVKLVDAHDKAGALKVLEEVWISLMKALEVKL